jgi:Domain of unknown function (DUF4351)
VFLGFSTQATASQKYLDIAKLTEIGVVGCDRNSRKNTISPTIKATSSLTSGHDLPKGLEKTLWNELKTFEEECKVTYVTTGERIGFEQGMQQGVQQGELTIVLRLLTRRVGRISPDIEAKIRALSLTQVETLGEALLDFSQPSNLDDWLKLHS